MPPTLLNRITQSRIHALRESDCLWPIAVTVFAPAPNPGVLNIDGRMFDMPHYNLALCVLANLDNISPSSDL